MKLYKLDNKKKVRTWEVELFDDGYEVSHGVMGGELQTVWTDVWEGKVNRTAEEQIELETNSLIKKKKDRGYVDTIEQAMEGPKNSLGLKIPMKAQTFDASKLLPDDEDYFMQYKYNGHRCLVTRHKGELIAYSKTGQLIKTVNHVLNEYSMLHEGEIIDGELYVHGLAIQSISSLVRREQPESRSLRFVVYDWISPKPYRFRYADLRALVEPLERSQLAPTRRYKGAPKHLASELADALDKGYEGLILRYDGYAYEDDKRSAHMLKIKKWITEEYVVTSIKPGKNGQAILTCHISPDLTVDCTAPGTFPEKVKTMVNSELFIGRFIQLQFAEYTPKGIPFHPVAVYWRDPE